MKQINFLQTPHRTLILRCPKRTEKYTSMLQKALKIHKIKKKIRYVEDKFNTNVISSMEEYEKLSRLIYRLQIKAEKICWKT